MSNRLVSLACCIFFSSMFGCLSINAQDTSRITIQNAEKQFLEKNLQLLAEKYNIDIARAAVYRPGYTTTPIF